MRSSIVRWIGGWETTARRRWFQASRAASRLPPRTPRHPWALGFCVSVRILPTLLPASVGADAPTLCAAGGGAPLSGKRRATRVRALRASQARAYPGGSGCAGRAAALRSPRLFGAPPNGSGAPMARPCRLRRRASQLRRAVSRARSRAHRGCGRLNCVDEISACRLAA